LSNDRVPKTGLALEPGVPQVDPVVVPALDDPVVERERTEPRSDELLRLSSDLVDLFEKRLSDRPVVLLRHGAVKEAPVGVALGLVRTAPDLPLVEEVPVQRTSRPRLLAPGRGIERERAPRSRGIVHLCSGGPVGRDLLILSS
jgi:hypothetical protein